MANGNGDAEVLTALGQLIIDHDAKGQPFIEAPGVVDAFREILADAGYVELEVPEDEDDGEDDDDDI